MLDLTTTLFRPIVAASLLLLAFAATSASADSEAPTTPRLSCANGPHSQGAAPVDGDPHWQLRQEIAPLLGDALAPGTAIIAVRNNDIIFEMYSGCRSTVEDWPVEKDTVFLLASVSKTVTAVTFLHLVDRLSALNLDGLELPLVEKCFKGAKTVEERTENFLNCSIETFLKPIVFHIDFPKCECPPSNPKCEGWREKTWCPECQGCGTNPCPRPPGVRFVELMEHTSGIIDVYDGPLNCTYNLDADSPMSLKQMVHRYLNKEDSTAHPNELFCMNVNDVTWSTSHYKAELYSPCNFGPYGQFKYSNSGYTLLGHMMEVILEDVCPVMKNYKGGTYENELLKEECAASVQDGEHPMWKYSQAAVLKPLGMKPGGELAGRWLFSELEDHEACAALDTGDGIGAPCRIARPSGYLPYYSFPGYPNGGFHTTARGLSHFLRMLMSDGTWNGPDGDEVILYPETARDIWNFTGRPWPWQSLTSRGFTAAALGFALQAIDISEEYNGMIMGHTGGEMGVATFMFWLPVPKVEGGELMNDVSKSLGVLVLSNGELLGPDVMLKVFEYFQDGNILFPPAD